METVLTPDIRPIRPQLRKEILKAHDYKCAYCGDPATVVDHVIPLSKGGHTMRGNLVAACFKCNSTKAGKMLEEWRPDEWERCTDANCGREHLAKVKF